MKKKESGGREKIVEAATDLIRERGGAQELTMRDIAARAGVGVGLANYHFQTKENLVALCTRRASEAFEKIAGVICADPGREPVGKLRSLAGEYMKFLAEDPGIARASLLGCLSAPSPADDAARTLGAFLPAVREACAGRATETETKTLCHLLASSLQAAFLRSGAFGEFAGLDARDEAKGRQLADVAVYVLFQKYL